MACGNCGKATMNFKKKVSFLYFIIIDPLESTCFLLRKKHNLTFYSTKCINLTYNILTKSKIYKGF